MYAPELAEQLKRFGPYAKVIITDKEGQCEDFEISFLSPATDCRIEVDMRDGMRSQIDELEKDYEDLGVRLANIVKMVDTINASEVTPATIGDLILKIKAACED